MYRCSLHKGEEKVGEGWWRWRRNQEIITIKYCTEASGLMNDWSIVVGVDVRRQLQNQ